MFVEEQQKLAAIGGKLRQRQMDFWAECLKKKSSTRAWEQQPVSSGGHCGGWEHSKGLQDVNSF